MATEATDEQVIAALSPLLLDERRARIDQVASCRLSGIAVVLENLSDPHNGAAVLRSAETQGVLEVWTTGSKLRFSERVTQGADKWLTILHDDLITTCVEDLKARGFSLCAAVPGAASSLDDLDPKMPTAFFFGNEHEGLSAAARRLVDVEFSIPMVGFSESLNLSVACAITLYTHARRRRQALGCTGDLDATALLHLRARYYRKDVRGAEAVIARYLKS